MTVLEAVKKSKTPIFLNKKAVDTAQQMLAPEEDVIWAQISNVYQHPIWGELKTEVKISDTDVLPGVVVVTTQRILFVYHILNNYSSKEVRIADIRAIDSKVNFTLEVLRIAGTSSMIVTYAKRHIIAKLRDAINEAIAEKNTQMPAQTTVDKALEASDIQQLQALKQLYDTGVITAEEFAAKKAQILNL